MDTLAPLDRRVSSSPLSGGGLPQSGAGGAADAPVQESGFGAFLARSAPAPETCSGSASRPEPAGEAAFDSAPPRDGTDSEWQEDGAPEDLSGLCPPAVPVPGQAPRPAAGDLAAPGEVCAETHGAEEVSKGQCVTGEAGEAAPAGPDADGHAAAQNDVDEPVPGAPDDAVGDGAPDGVSAPGERPRRDAGPVPVPDGGGAAIAEAAPDQRPPDSASPPAGKTAPTGIDGPGRDPFPAEARKANGRGQHSGAEIAVTDPQAPETAQTGKADLLVLPPAGPGGAQQVAGQTGTPAALASQISRQIAEMAATRPENAVALLLSPEELGRVAMTFSPKGEGIAVSLVVDRPETLDLMRRHIDVLSRDLRDLGFAHVDISFGTPRRDPQDHAAPPASPPDEAASFPGTPVPIRMPPMPAPVVPAGLDLRL